MTDEVKQFFDKLDPRRHRICRALHELAMDELPEFRVSIKWSQPVYELQDRICYLQAHSDHVNFGFWRGAELGDPDSLLEGSGKAMRHVKVRSVDAIPKDGLRRLLRAAAELDRGQGS